MQTTQTSLNTALLVIDMQEAFFEDPGLDSQKEHVIEQCNKLIRYFNKQAMPVVMVQTEHSPTRETWTLSMLDDNKGYLFTGDDHTRLVDGLLVGKARHVIKTRDSAFFNTNLHQLLGSGGIMNLVLCGVSTQNCILQTAVDAYSYNFRVMIASDAIASDDQKFHGLSLSLLRQDYRQKVISTDALIAHFNALINGKK